MPKPHLTFTRRQVLAASAAAAIAPTMLTGRSWAQATANNQMGAVLIGAGKRGARAMFRQFLNHPKIKLLAIAEVDSDRRNHWVAQANKHYGANVCVGVNDYRELMDRKDLDIALIFTPDHWHTIPAMHAMQRGMHVYAEKPLTLNLRESQLIIQAQQKAGVTFQTGSQQRNEFGGRFITAVEYVINGRLGKCELAEVGCGDPAIPCDLPTEEQPRGLDWDLWQGPAPERGYHHDLSPRGVHNHFPAFRKYEEYAGGPLADFGGHMFDIAQWAFGKDRESPVTITPPEDENAKRGVQMTYADGKKMVHATIGNGVRFIGENGTIHVTRNSLTSQPASILEQPLTNTDKRLHKPQNHLNNFIDCIGTDTQPVCDAQVGARTAALCHLANISYDLRTHLKFDGNAWKFTNSQAANAKLDYAQRREGFELPAIG